MLFLFPPKYSRTHRSFFSKFGGVVRLVLPPSHTVALVELPTPQEARAAFRGLAYRRFHNEPIYLEVHWSELLLLCLFLFFKWGIDV